MRSLRMVIGASTVITLAWLSAATLAAPQVGRCDLESWPQPRQNACATATAISDGAPSPATVGRLELAWSKRLAAPVDNPIAANGRVYVVVGSSRPRLDALDLDDGRYRWSAIAGVPGDYAPLADGDVLLRLSAINTLRRYNVTGGRILWRRYIASDPESGSGTQQVVADGNWYMSQGEQLVAYEIRQGGPRWTRDLQCFACSIAADAGRVYAAGATGDGRRGALYAFDSRTGKTIWSSQGAGRLTVAASPLVVGDEIVVVTTDSQEPWSFSVEAFRAADGEKIWRTHLGPGPGFSPDAAAAAGDGIFAYASTDGFLYALDTRTGAVRWKVRVDADESDPAIAHGLVWIVSGSDELSAFGATDGRRLWTGPAIPGLAASSPIVAGRFVLVGTPDGRLRGYAAPTT